MPTSPPDRILLDTVCYLRLGRLLSPLFGRAWGNSPGIEFVAHRAASAEYFHNPGLRSKFDWVQEEPWLSDLKNGKVRLRQGQKDSIVGTLEFLQDATTTLGLSCSDADRRCLATAMELSIPLATDDTDLKALAEAFDAPVQSSLQVLKRLVDQSAIDLPLVRDIVLQWQADDDFRVRFWKEYKNLFGEECPKLRTS